MLVYQRVAFKQIEQKKWKKRGKVWLKVGWCITGRLRDKSLPLAISKPHSMPIPILPNRFGLPFYAKDV
jgi:hypothetical protein